MKTETIKAIFTNLLFVIGVLLTVFGFVRSVQTFGRVILFDKYPLASFEETSCDRGVRALAVPGEKPAELEFDKESCLFQLEQTRRIKQFDDVVQASSILVSGLVITYSFRRFVYTHSRNGYKK